MKQKNKATMTREQAAQLYDELKSALERKHGKKRVSDLLATEQKKADVVKRGLVSSSAALTRESSGPPSAPVGLVGMPVAAGLSGASLAFFLVVTLVVAKIVLGLLEVLGVGAVEPAIAATAAPVIQSFSSSEEGRLLKSLDARRAELEDRSRKLDERAADLGRRDREFAGRLTELRELSQRLKVDRQKEDRRRVAQLDQLANVYSSMNPQEAAQLIEQLDLTIALALIERMPEKRIGQILSLMSSDRALTLTRMLSRQ